MLDVTRMVKSRSITNHGEASFGSPLVKHDEPFGITRSKDGGWAHNRDPHSVLEKLVADLFTFPFGLLVPIGRGNRRRFIRRWMLDVAVHAAGRTIEDPWNL